MKKKIVKRVVAFFLCSMLLVGLCWWKKGEAEALTSFTRADAISWCYAQEGKQDSDIDGNGKWCVDLVTAYMNKCWLTVNGRGSENPWKLDPYTTCNANQYDNRYGSNPNWELIERTSSTVPKRGDIFISENDSSGMGVGHVGIILEVNGSTGAKTLEMSGGKAPFINNVTWGSSASYKAEHFLRFRYFSDMTPVSVTEGMYYVYSKLGCRLLTIKSSGTADGTNIQINSPLGNTSQVFEVKKNTTYSSYQLFAKNSGKCLDTQGNTKGVANVQQWAYTAPGNEGQNWYFEDAGDGFVFIRNKWGYYLDVADGKNVEGQNVQVVTHNGSDAQKWKLIKASGINKTMLSADKYVFYSKTGNRVLEIANGSTENRANARINSYNGGNAQIFSAGTNSDWNANWVSLYKSNKFLDSEGNKIEPENLILWEGNGAAGQQWFFESCGDGYYYIRNMWGYYVDVLDGLNQDGQNVRTFNFNGSNAQKWKPVAVRYTISFNANNGSGAPGSQTKKHDEDLTLSTTTPSRSGYKFLGWATSNNASTAQYSAGAKYTANKSVTLYAVWQPNQYTITFNANGGSGAPAAQKKTHGTNLTLSSTKPTKTGYDFLGWATSSNATSAQYAAGATFTANANTTLYAVWKIKTYKISFNANGGSEAPVVQTKTYGVNLTLTSLKPVRTGYTFQGWATSSNATSAQYSAGATFTKDADTTLYAVWKIIQYSVTYNANGGSGAPNAQTKNYGTDLTLSSTKPTRTGYTFQGWATTSNATSVQYAAGAKYTNNANATLYAVWKINSYKLQYNANGGTGTLPAAVTVNYNEKVTVERVQVTFKGYYFLGWATTASATEASYKSGDSVVMKGNVTLYAVWKPRTNKITFNANGGTGTLPETISVLTGKNGTIGKASVSRTGYYFLGWSTSKTATAADLKTGSSISVDEDTVLYAVWKPRTNKITFNANGGTGTLPEEISVLTGKKAVIGAAKMQRAAHYFLGWATSKTATAATYKTGSEISVAQDTILYAVWKKAGTVYKVTFDANGGKGSVPAATEVAAGAGIDIPSVSLTRDGFYFIGWSTKKDAKTAEFVGGYHFTPTKDTTIYAVWKKK